MDLFNAEINWYFLASVVLNIFFIMFILYKKYFVSKKYDESCLINYVDQLPCHIYWKSLDGSFIESNYNNRNDFGFPNKKDFIGLTDYQIFSKEQADQVTIFDKEVIQKGETLVQEEVLTNSDGTKSVYLSYKSPLRDKNNIIIGLSGISVDVTQANNKISHQLKMLDDIISLMPGNVYWIDREGYYLGCNDNEAQHVGLEHRHNIIGKKNIDMPEFIHPDRLDEINERVMTTGQSITVEEPAILKDGSEAIFLSNKVPLKDNNANIVGLLGISIDITDRKNKENELKLAKEKAEEAILIKNDFIKNIEHDLRTPFSGLLGISELLLDMEDDPEKKAMVDHIVSAAKQLLDYHNKVLDFSKISTGKLPVSKRKFNLRNLIENIVSIEKPAAINKHLDFIYNYDSNIPPVLIGDEYRVNRILLNLIGNAIKFTKQGAINISIKLQSAKDKVIILDFIVKDTGIGIPTEKQMYIFEQFTRLNPSNQGEYTGLGIGLKVVKEFTQDLSGDIDLHSEINKGTKYTITIPFEVPLTQKITNSLE
jgi:two-component system aerobic respiration control sensor histidine kinase ArcB